MFKKKLFTLTLSAILTLPIIVGVSAQSNAQTPHISQTHSSSLTSQRQAATPTILGFPDRFSANPSTPVFVVGDSLTVGSRNNIIQRYRNANVPVTITAENGKSTEWGMWVLALSPAAKRAQVWVVALGTNDISSEPAYATRMRHVMKMAGSRKVVWINVYRPGYDYGVNSAISNVDREYPNLLTVNFRAWVQGFPSILAGDRLHLTPYGYAFRSIMYGPSF